MKNIKIPEASHSIPIQKYITLKIAKFNPKNDSSMKFVSYKISYEKWMTVLDAILEIKKYIDSSIAIRYSCRQASCGSCGVTINGKPALSCFTKINEIDSNTIKIEPMKNFPIIRDLVVDFKTLFSAHKKMKPYIIRDDSEITQSNEKEYIQSPSDVEKFIQFSNCIKCGLCNSACPTVATDSSFIGPQSLTQSYRYIADNRDAGKDDRLKIADTSHGAWRCHFAGSCSKVCPKGVDPALGIQLLKSYLLGIRR